MLVPKSSDRAVTDMKACRRSTVAAEIGGKVSTFHLNYLKMSFIHSFIHGKELHFEPITSDNISVVFNFLTNVI